MKNIIVPDNIFIVVYWVVKQILIKDNPKISQADFNNLLHEKLADIASHFEDITHDVKSPTYYYNHFLKHKKSENKVLSVDFGVFFLLMTVISRENNIQFDESDFNEGFKRVFDLIKDKNYQIERSKRSINYIITAKEISILESEYSNHLLAKSEKKYTMYRCYYYSSKDSDTVSFFTKVNFDERRAVAIKTQSGHDFIGDIVTKEISVGTSLFLRNKDEEENKRALHILLSDGHIDFPKRELSIGLFLNINEGTTLPEGGIIIFERIGEGFNQKSANDLIDEHEVKSIPEPIRFYLNKKTYRIVDTDVTTLKSLEKLLKNKHPHWNNLEKITKRIVGIYKCFTINRDGSVATNYFLFKDDGSFECKTNDFFDYSGFIKVEPTGNLLLSMHAGKLQSYYKIFIGSSQKFQIDKLQKLKAVYSGIARDNQPKGGRCFFIRMTDNEIREIIREYALQKNGDFSFTVDEQTDKADNVPIKLKDSEYEILFGAINVDEEKDISQLEPKNEGLTSFLSGIDNKLLEDGGKLLIENIRFPDSERDLLSKLGGVYEYYRTSGYKKNTFVKKYPLQMTIKGKVTVYGNYPSIGQGLVYNGYLFIHLFNTEKYTNNYISPNHNPKKYDGVAVFKIDEDDLYKPMLGVYQSFNADDMMVVGRIILIRTKTDIVGEAASYQIRTPEFELLDEETNGIASFLTGRLNNIIGYSEKNINEIEQGERLSKELDIGTHLFDSACWKATNEDNDSALETLNQAILNGFNNEERFSKEVTGGAFNHIKKTAIDIWDSHILY